MSLSYLFQKLDQAMTDDTAPDNQWALEAITLLSEAAAENPSMPTDSARAAWATISKWLVPPTPAELRAGPVAGGTLVVRARSMTAGDRRALATAIRALRGLIQYATEPR